MQSGKTLIEEPSPDIAVIGLAGRFPGARDVAEYWKNLQAGVESISFFSDEDLIKSGVKSAWLTDPHYVKAAPILHEVESFDAQFFGYSPREACMMDPQHRLFLECAWEAVENAGYDIESYRSPVGVYAGSAMNTYLLSSGLLPQLSSEYLFTLIGSDKDFLTTRVSYKLNLTGPSITVQTACSTSLVAVHLACQSLLNGECDMALAGGVSVRVPQKAGYFYEEGSVFSPDGHCRAFDARAQGTIFGSGVAIVVLKRLADSIRDRDCIHAVIKGSAVNNDGAMKTDYTSPSLERQAQVVIEALANAGVDAGEISYLEAHGTGTKLGDPIEVAALTKAFRAYTERRGYCAIGSVKTNIGHLETVAGVAGLIKTVLALKHRVIPPTLHYEEANPEIDFASSPFYVNSRLTAWESGTEKRRRAGVSSLGVGGTNAHVIVEEAPELVESGESHEWQLLVLSARSPEALEQGTRELAEYLEEHRELELANVAHTLQVGRKSFDHRRIVVCKESASAVSALKTLDAKCVRTATQKPANREIAFMFSGQGAQYVNMGLKLYHVISEFTKQIDRCSEILQPHLSLDLRELLFSDDGNAQQRSFDLNQTFIAQPALFAIEYALAEFWMSLGLHPHALIGHSVGEYVAACLAGVFSLEDALTLVVKRGRLMQELSGGSMLAVPCSEREIQPSLSKKLSLASVNGPSLCVVSGETQAVKELETLLSKQGLNCRYLNTSHAFHSEMMEPILQLFTEHVEQIGPKAPKIPFVSNVTGTWITANEAMDPGYWARHARQTVRFADGIGELLKEPYRILLEVGPGQTLSSFVRLHPDRTANQVVLSSLRHPLNTQSDLPFLLNTLGQLWLTGARINWSGFNSQQRRQRVVLPTYPFQRQRYWIEGTPVNEIGASSSGKSAEKQGASTPLEPQIRSAGFRAISKKLRGLSGALKNLHRWATSAKNGGDSSSRSPHESGVKSSNGQRSQSSQERPGIHSLAGTSASYIGRRSDIEAVVRSVWQDVLGIPQVGSHDDFFELGGHSVLITQIISRLNRKFQMELPVLSLIESPTVDGLTQYIEAVHRIERTGQLGEVSENLAVDK